MNRRDLLGLSLAAVGGVFAPRFGRWYRRGSGVVVYDTAMTEARTVTLPLLYGDGVRDDSKALQAYLDGKLVHICSPDGGTVPATFVTVSGRRFLLSETLRVDRLRTGIGMEGSVLQWTRPMTGIMVS